MKAHREALLGPAARWLEEGYVDIAWHLGYVVRLTMLEWFDGLDAILAHESFSRVRAIDLAPIRKRGRSDFVPAIAAVARAPVSATVLRLDDYDFWRWSELGRLDPLWPSHPRLRVVELNGNVDTMGPLDLPDLMALTVRSREMSQEVALEISSAALPSLERIELWFGDGGAHDRDLTDLLEGTLFPRLVHLALRATPFTDGLLERIAAAPLLPRLRTLDLAQGMLTDQGATRIVSQPERFRHLERIELGLNYLSRDMCARLSKIFGDRVQLTVQKPADDPYPSISDERFAV